MLSVQYGGMGGEVALREVVGWRFVAHEASIQVHSLTECEGTGRGGVAMVDAFGHPDARMSAHDGVGDSIVDIVHGVGPRGAVTQSRTGGGDIDNAIGIDGQHYAAVGRLVAADVDAATVHTRIARQVGSGGVGGVCFHQSSIDQDGALLHGPVASIGIFVPCAIGGLNELGTGKGPGIMGAEYDAATGAALG